MQIPYINSILLHTCIAGNFVRILIWQFGEFGKYHQIKNLPIQINVCMHMAPRILIANFEFRQYQLRVDLMLNKTAHYTVYHSAD